MDEQNHMNAPMEMIRRNQAIVDEIGSDELPAKYDMTRERGLPPAVAYYGDNKLFKEKPDFERNREDMLRFLGQDPVRLAVYKTNDDRARLDEIFRTGNLINRNETPQVRYGRVAADVYDRPEGLESDRITELNAAGWERVWNEKDMYRHRDGRRVYRPVLQSWVEGPKEKKVNDSVQKMVFDEEYDQANKEYDAHLDTAKMLATFVPDRTGGIVNHAAMYLENNVRVKPSEAQRVEDVEKAERLQKLTLTAVWLRQLEGENWQARLNEKGYFEARMAEFWRATGTDPRGFKPEELAKLDISKTDPAKLFNFFGVLSLRESVQFRRDFEDYRAGKMNRYERADFKLRLWQKKYDELMGETFGKQAAETIVTSLGEMGAFGIAHKPVTAGGSWLFRKFGIDLAAKSGLVAKVAKTVGLVGAEEALRLPLYTPEIIANVMAEQDQSALRYNPETRQMELDLSPEKQLALGAMVLKHVTERGIENVSERLGGAFEVGRWSRMLGKIPPARVREIGAAAGNAMARKIPFEKLRPLARQMKNVRDVTQFHGLVGEVLEEEGGKAMGFGLTKLGEALNIDGWAALDVRQPFMTPEERLLTFVSVGSLCGLMNLPGGMVKFGEIRAKAQRLDLMDRTYQYLHPKDGEKVPSRAVAEDLLDTAISQNLSFGLDAGKFRALYQESPELQTALNFAPDELALLNNRAEEHGTVEVPFTRLAVIEQHDLYRKVSDLALDTEGGGILSAAPEPVSPEVAAEIRQEMEAEEQLAGAKAEAANVKREQQRRELDAELERFGTELSSRFSKTQVKAELELLGAMARGLARASGKSPAELLKPLTLVANSSYEDFVRKIGERSDVPFQAAAAALRRPGAPNHAENRNLLRDGRVPSAPGFKELYGFTGERFYADYEFLYARHTEYFNSPEEARAAVEFVLHNPEPVADMGKNAAFVGFDPTTGNIYRVEIEKAQRGSDNHIRSVHAITAMQYQKVKLADPPLLQVSPTSPENGGQRARDVASFLRYDNATDMNVKEQSTENQKKGAYDPRTHKIHLFQAADVSSLSHEVIHYFYDMFEMLEAEGLLEGTPLKEDLETIRRESTREDGTFDHEKLPKAFEYYLKRGEAPNEALQKVFSRFRDWLTRIYNTVKGYFDDNPLPTEIKEIFDRWLAAEETAQRLMSDDAVVGLFRQTQLSGIGTAARQAILPWAENEKEKLLDNLDRARAAGRARAAAEARKAAGEILSSAPVYKLRQFLRENGKLDAAAVKALFGPDVLKRLRQKGVIAKTPRAARPGEEFHDPEQRRDKEIGLRQRQAAFDEYLYTNHYLAWLIRGNNYGRIKPDPKFGILKEQAGSFFDLKKGMESDLAARELSEMASFEISEQELIDALSDMTYREIRRNFQTEYRDNQAYWDAEAENALRLDSQTELDRVATENGYENAAKMVDALLNAPTEYEYTKAAAEYAAERFEENFPASETVAAADSTLEQLDTLIGALSIKTNSAQARRSKEDLKKVAQDRVDQMPLASALRTDLRLQAVESNAKECAAALKKEDWQTALDAARRLNLNCAMLAVQQKKRSQVEGIPRRVKQIARKHSRGAGLNKVAGDVCYYYRTLARDFGFTDDEMKRVARPEHSLETILANSGMDITMEQLPRVRDYRQLTVKEFDNLHEFMKQLYRYSLDLVKNTEAGRSIELHQNIEAVVSSLAAQADRQVSGSLWSSAVNFASDATASLNSLLHFSRKLDGYKNVTGEAVGGIIERLGFNKLHRSDARQKELLERTLGKLMPSIDYFFNRFREIPKELIGLPEFSKEHRRFTDGKWSPEMALAAALNWGNLANRERLLAGYQWEAGQVESILSVFDRAADWEHIQQIWDAVDSLYPELNGVFKRVNYRTLAREEAESFTVQTREGEITVKGGYMPIRYDGKLLFGRNGEFELNLDHGTARRAAPGDGMTQQRLAHTGMAVELSLDGLVRHVKATTRYIAFKETAREVMAVFDSADVAREITAKFGAKTYAAFRDHLVNAINPDAGQQNAFLSKVKRALVSGALWGRLGTALKQSSTMFTGIDSVGGVPMWLANAARFDRHPLDCINEVNNLSPFMRERSKGKDRDIVEEIGKLRRTLFDRGLNKFRNLGFLPINLMDRCAVYPMWMAAYQHAQNRGFSQADAVLIADKHIVDTQGSNRDMDTTTMQRAKGWGLFLMFVGPLVAQSNRITAHTLATAKGEIGAGRYSSAMVSDFLIPTIMTAFINLLLANSLGDLGSDDDKKRRKAWLELLSEGSSIMLAGIPLARELPNVLVEGRLPNHPASSAIRAIHDPWRAFQKRDKDGDRMPDEVLYQTVKSASFLLGVPVVPAWESVRRIQKKWGEDEK